MLRTNEEVSYILLSVSLVGFGGKDVVGKKCLLCFCK